MISVVGGTKMFGQTAVLCNVNLTVRKSETVVLLGASGSGKTSLLRCMVGLYRFDAGSIEIDGTVIHAGDTGPDCEARLQTMRLKCGLIFQQYHLFPHRTVMENITLAPMHVQGKSRIDAEADALGLLDQMGLASKRDQKPARLSGGEQQRVAIARALALKPQYLLYDEPTSALDKLRAQEVWSLMRELSQAGQTQVIVTHQEELASALDCRVIRMVNGTIEAAQTGD